MVCRRKNEAVFADTFYYLALLNPNDEAQQKAMEFTAGFAATATENGIPNRIVFEFAWMLGRGRLGVDGVRYGRKRRLAVPG